MSNQQNNILNGIAAAPGIAIAKAYQYHREAEEVRDEPIDNIPEALENLNEAFRISKRELKKIFSLAVDKLGKKRAAILEAQLMILDDPILTDTILKRIKTERKLPEYIVYDEFTKYQDLMISSHHLYMKERSQDIEDIKNRIIKNLKKKKWKSKISNDMILVASNLSPADTVLFSRVDVKGYVTNFGGLTSHAAIFSRSLNIPAVVGVHDATSRIEDGDTLIIDGFHGDVIINPTPKQLKFYQEKIAELDRLGSELKKIKDLPAETIDGRRIAIMGNLDLTAEVYTIIQNGGKGIGLVRTEQLFQESEQFPDEETQFEYYSQLASKIYPENVIIRAFDIGGDKVLPFDVKEPNPMLGWRGVRFLLDNRELFKRQIRAVLRAGIHKNIKFMIPMVSTISEIYRSKEIISECKAELDREGFKFDDKMKIGIMIEVPSAAVMIKDYAEEVDFISIGTNDLVQYLLAVDRGNEIVSSQYLEYHPAVIRTLHHILSEAKQVGVSAGLCGEMAAEIKAAPLLIGLGLESFSVSGSVIPILKRVIRKLKYSDCKKLIDECLLLRTEPELHTKINDFLKTHLAEETELIE